MANKRRRPKPPAAKRHVNKDKSRPAVSGVAAEGIAGKLDQGTPPLGVAVRAVAGGQPEAVPPFPPPHGNILITRPQEQPPRPSVLSGAGVQAETVSLSASTMARFDGSATLTLTPAPLTVMPTPYPRDPTAPLMVDGSPQTDVRSQDFQELNAKLDQIIGLLAGSNQIAGDIRDQLIAEIRAGKALLPAPKPNVDLLKTLLVHPLVWIASAAAGGVIGDLAAQALHLIQGIFQIPIPL